METKAALVRSDGTAELNTVAHVYMNFSLVIEPWNTKFDNSFRSNQPFQNSILAVRFLICLDYNTKRFKYFLHCLQKFRLVTISFLDHGIDIIYV